MPRSSPEGPDSFPTTNWSNVRDAAAVDASSRRGALDDLLRRYRPALWAHLVYRKKEAPDRADDVVQSFIQQKILQRNLLEAADPARGKLRTLLLTALDRFWIDCRRRDTPRVFAGDFPPDTSTEGPADVSNVAWAMHVLVESVKRLRAECEVKQRPDLWGVFAGRALASVCGSEPLSYNLLAERLGLHSGHQAANRLPTAQAMFQRNLQAELSDYAGADVDVEIAELRQSLSLAGPEILEQMRIHLWSEVPEVTMSASGDSRTDPLALSRLLELPRPSADSAALLQQGLTGPLPLDVTCLEVELVPGSLAELLHHPNPPAGLLDLAKHFAKETRDDPDSPLPREVSTLLYYASISVALARCGRRITRHDDATLRQGFEWGCAQPWVDEPTRDLLREGLRALGSADAPRE
jgi:RNA polymerase sigma-70 factor (ECF subfamily)